jgi:hypothetical protein
MGGASRRRFGAALPRLGAVVSVVVLGLVFGGCGGSGSGTQSDSEPQRFLDALDTAVRRGDTEYRIAHLHPAVIARYGEQQCRDFLASPPAQDTTRRDKVKSVGKPAPFEYVTDDGSIPVPNAVLVVVEAVHQGKKSERELHLARVGGQFTYFIDCGSPLMRQ